MRVRNLLGVGVFLLLTMGSVPSASAVDFSEGYFMRGDGVF